MEFPPEVKHFLGDGHLNIYMNKAKDIADLIKKAGLDQPQTLTTPTPYPSGYPVDSVPDVKMPQHERNKLNKLLQELVGSMN